MDDYVLPRSVKGLFSSVESMLDGMRDSEEGLSLPPHLTVAQLEQALTKARSSSESLKVEAVRGPALEAACKRASAATKPFFPAAKLVFGRHFGKRWNRKWTDNGWITPRGRLPVAPAQRERMLASLWTHFRDHPEHQDPGRGVTNEVIVRLYHPLREARLALEAYETQLSKVRRERNRAMKHLRKMMREVVAHLDTILDNVEESWEPFGLVPPSLQLPPGGIWPLNLVPLPTEDGSGKLQVTWGQAPRALYYEVFLQTGGGPKEFQFVDSIAATELVLENLPVNTRIRVWVVPVNLAGQGLGMEKEVALGG